MCADFVIFYDAQSEPLDQELSSPDFVNAVAEILSAMNAKTKAQYGKVSDQNSERARAFMKEAVQRRDLSLEEKTEIWSRGIMELTR